MNSQHNSEIDRNTIEGFAQRVSKNLTFMISARERGSDVHIVTELTNALLGLIVFPYEHFKVIGFLDLKDHRLDDLVANGWPAWTFYIGHSRDLNNLIWHLRNALSHRRVRFSSDDRALEKVEVTFWDRPKPGAPDNWSATINAAALLNFVFHLSKLIGRHT
jgi:hypothetical protein